MDDKPAQHKGASQTRTKGHPSKMSGPEEQNNPSCKLLRHSCGIIMPISAMDGCPEEHWNDVRDILYGAAKAAGFEPSLVSDAMETSVIQRTIVRNLFKCDIVVCDVSCKNSNVMFELGMRLAFDKPVVIVKDEETSYSFDVGNVEHISYPRNLSYYRILKFTERLAQKITSTYEASSNGNHSSFLGSFGDINAPERELKGLTNEQAILEFMANINSQVKSIKNVLADRSHGGINTITAFPYSDYEALKKSQTFEGRVNAFNDGKVSATVRLNEYLQQQYRNIMPDSVVPDMIWKIVDEVPESISRYFTRNELFQYVSGSFVNCAQAARAE